jgi:putative glycosyltransferase (TIGR04348 family)
LTGTDVYGSIHTAAKARRSLDLATRLVVLQPLAIAELPKETRAKARVIFQSVPLAAARTPPRADSFDVCVLGHLRPVKDPLRAARAARLALPASRLRVLHFGKALSKHMAAQARKEQAANPRYHWFGELPRRQALRRLARAHLLVLTSKSEGGANVISEALAHFVPVISSRIAGSVGLLGEAYPGYFPVGDTHALAALLERAEFDKRFYENLQTLCKECQPLIDPERERRSWEELLHEVC